MTDGNANQMWGGRFQMSPAEIMEQINTSIDFDKRLAREDIAGSKVHAAMLAATGIITDGDREAIDKGLDQILVVLVEPARFECRASRCRRRGRLGRGEVLFLL